MKKLKNIILLLCLFVPFSFVGCENKNKETLSTPSIVSINGGTIVFEQVPNAEYYTISINDYTLILNVLQNKNVEIIDGKINFDASNIFVVGESYAIKIQASANNMNDSKYSATCSYKHNGTIEKPTGLKINGSILTWNAVQNASYYVVKIITPADELLFDKSGNILTEDDPESIAKADLTEYSFNTNQFDFSSLLSKAGKYKFYISAVLSVGTSYVDSGYTTPIEYSHYVTLETPTNGIISKQGSSLHMLTAIDLNANAISIICNGYEKTTEINGSDQSITILNQNLLDINLNQYFQTLITAGKLSFEDLSQFSVQTQAKRIASSPENAFYINSTYSDYVYFENTQTLSAPTLSIEQDLTHNCYKVGWTTDNENLISEYKLLVFSASGVKEYLIDANTSSKLIYEDFIAVAIKAKGIGNYISSPLSTFVAKPTLSANPYTISTQLNGKTLSWDEIEGAYYVVEFEGQYLITTENKFNIDTTLITSTNYNIKVTAILNGYVHSTVNVPLNFSAQLATPTFNYGQGFTGTNLYELTFTGSDNAIGYYVYLKATNASEFEKIDTLYLTTRIDLSKYICSEGNYTDYQVKVQAVADIHSLYSNSELSQSVSVSHIKVLDTPEFYKLGNTITPITKQVVGNTTKYILKFYGVESAESYEILINYNKISIPSKNNFYTDIYEVDLSNYLIAANNYEIKIRAIPSSSNTNVQASDYATANYALTKQLSMVENINISETDGIYTLSFDPIDNAESYKIRIVKENDSGYVSYLNSINLSNIFEVTQSVDVTNYVKQQGVYYFYVTALAPKQNSYYADAIESTNYGYISKLTTLNSPSNVTYTNASKSNFFLNWEGDFNADYYLVKITDPNNIVSEVKVYNTNNDLIISADINKYMTVQGTYTFDLFSMISPLSENAKEYASSFATTESIRYIYQYQKDFERYSIYMNGGYYNFVVSSASHLKNLLWYHYLYEIEQGENLTFMLVPQTKEDGTDETIREIILRIATEANNASLHNFNEDEQWDLLLNSNASDNDLFSYICQTLIKAYPELNILEGFDLYHVSGNVFNLYYKNTLNKDKVQVEQTTFTNTNYGNEYTFIDPYSRKSATGTFKIDSREEMLVTTTEQLLQAVQNNRKPKFIGNSATAELIYYNAKLALSAIVTNNMSDLEKVTAIFDWLESAFDVTYYSIDNQPCLTGTVDMEDLKTYGLNNIYYLEGMFEGLTIKDNGDIVANSNLATSFSYSKAFALMCGIEGIEATVVNGNYTYKNSSNNYIETNVAHAWNKVYLSTNQDQSIKSWFNVDLTFSDNRIIYNSIKSGYGISSHTYFLTTDDFISNNLNVEELKYTISSSKKSEKNYSYYKDSRFALTYTQIDEAINNFVIYGTAWECYNCGHIHKGTTAPAQCPVCYNVSFQQLDNQLLTTGFNYAKHYDPSITYQAYNKVTDYGNLQLFLLNAMIYSKYCADNNASHKSVFEFSFAWKDNGNNPTFNIQDLKTLFSTMPNLYGLKINLAGETNTLYTVQGNDNNPTTIVVFAVEKTA
ncbi:MAG: hypothetical protein IJW36_01880 [Clostridia bacterium]|nr:hypothetical protein [Clostridia bacterium]